MLVASNEEKSEDFFASNLLKKRTDPRFKSEVTKIKKFKERTKIEKPTRKRTTPLEYSESKYITSRDFIDYSKKKEGERTKTTEIAVDNLLRIFPEYQTHLDSKKLADILREYKERNIPLEKIVIHGQEYIDAETGELKIREQGDIDTDAALEVLKNAGITWKKLDYVKKGEFIPGAFHIDTGGAYAVMLKEEKGADGKIQKTAFVDHHGASKAYPMSATLNMYNMLLEHGLLSLSDKNKYLIDLSRFVTDVDNLSYIKNPNRKYRSIALAEKLKIDPEKNPEGEFPINKNEPLIDENFFKSTWWKTPYGTVKQLPFSFILERTKKGIPPHQPFSKDEMEQKVITANGKEVLLKDLCERIKKNTNLSINLMEKSQDKMEDEYIKPQTKKLGKLVFNQSRIENKNGTQKEQDKMPIMFETARMAGYDSYILWNKDSKRIFISSVHDLENTYRSVKKIFPDSKLIRGVMIVAPLDPKWTEKYKDVTLADVKNALELNESKEEALARLQEEEAILNKTLENLKSQK